MSKLNSKNTVTSKSSRKIPSHEVYEILNEIPKGKVTTYKLIAQALGTKAYRGIGQILKANPNAPQVPCHRVVQVSGALGGYSGNKTHIKAQLLTEEGINVKDNKVIELEKFLYIPHRDSENQ